MGGLSLKEIALYEIVGEPVCLDKIAIAPAFYELIPEPTKYESILEFSLERYMTRNGYEFSDICPEFYKFSQPYSEFATVIQCDAIWVRAKIARIFNFYPPSAYGWRYELLNIPFLAAFFSNFSEFPSLHPFACTEKNLQAGLEFYEEVTTPEQRSMVANVFWKLLLRCPNLCTFIDVVLGDRYDDYDSVVMGNNFVSGYWNSKFHLVYV